MFLISEANTFWLNVTNVALGVVTVLCLVIVAYAAIKGIVIRLTRPVPKRKSDDVHVFKVPDVGLTMTDGGEKLYEDDERAFG